MTAYPTNGTTIEWKILALPCSIYDGTDTARLVYATDGTLPAIYERSPSTPERIYIGCMVLNRTAARSASVKSAGWEGSRFLSGTGSDKVLYKETDHLGSVRAVVDGNASMTTYPLAGFCMVDDYAPFGTKSTSSASSYLSLASTDSAVSLRDGFTGKEEQGPDFGVGYIDFGASQYSTTLSRRLVPIR